MYRLETVPEHAVVAGPSIASPSTRERESSEGEAVVSSSGSSSAFPTSPPSSGAPQSALYDRNDTNDDGDGSPDLRRPKIDRVASSISIRNREGTDEEEMEPVRRFMMMAGKKRDHSMDTEDDAATREVKKSKALP